jgi:phospholipid/cholesterol/gamma-HCH transport system substrate-binding protein
MMKPFHERNQVVVGAIGVALIVATVAIAFNLGSLPVLSGSEYRAAFQDASGLAPDNEVRVAGVKVGKVTDVALAERDGRPYVRVAFRIDGDVRLGMMSEAHIKIKTILGQKYLALEPSGPGRMSEHAEIPVERTTSPFDVIQAFKELAREVDQIDAARLAEAFSALSAAFEQTPPSVAASLQNLAKVSQAVATRDADLRSLLTHARAVTGVVAERDEELRKLIADSNLLLQELSRRRQAIHQLVVSTDQLAVQLSGLVTDNRAKLEPALRELRGVLAILQDHRAGLDRTLTSLGPFLARVSNTAANGRWVDVYVTVVLGA